MLKIKEQSNYLAKIVQLSNPVPHPNADKLEGFIIDGNRVWYSKGFLSSGKIVVYFPIECQINPVILSKLDLFADKNLNQNKEVAGYFDHKGRVRAIKLRGQPSEGFIMPLYHFDYATDSNIIESLDCTKLINKEFDTIDKKDEEMWICRKYVPAPARNSGTGPKSRTSFSNLLIENQFKFHKETPKLSANLHQLQPEDIISISYKLHGTSAVFANLLTKRKLSILERIAKWLGANIQTTEYSKMYSSRSVIKHIENKKMMKMVAIIMITFGVKLLKKLNTHCFPEFQFTPKL